MKRKIISILLTLVLVLSFSLVTAVPVAGAHTPLGTIYVDAAFVGTEDGGVATPFNTIGEAITHASGGDTISVAAGIYPESLTVDKEVSIIGAGPTTIIDPAPDADGITITANNVVIQDLKVSTESSGTDPNIAISIQETDNVEINTIVIDTTGNKAMGIWIGGSSNGLSPSSNLEIVGSTITINDVATGVYAAHSDPVHSGWIIGGSLSDANSVTANSANPVELYDVSASEVSYNTLTTTASGGSNVIWSSELSDLFNLVFSNNVVFGSGGSQVAFLTDFPAPEAPVTNIATVTISGNIFSNWGSRALRVGEAYSEGGTVTGITINSNTFNMTTTAEVIGGTDAPGATGTGNTFNVSPPATIQGAIDSAFSGDTINVAAGTYTENINIDKSLTLEGANAGVEATEERGPESIIDAQLAEFAVLINGAETVASFDGFTVENYDTVGILGGAFSVVLEGVPLGDDPVAVHILNNIVMPPTVEPPHNNNIQIGDGTTGTIIGNEVSGALLESEDWSGSGIIVAGSSNVLVSYNYVHNSEGGIQIVGYVEGGRPPAEDNVIEHNLVEDNESGIVPQGNSIGTVVRYNDLLNNSIGIEVMAYDYSWDHSTPSGTEVHSNNIVGNADYGVKSGVWGSDTGSVVPELVNATNNWWGNPSGPTHADNPFGIGDAVIGDVTYQPWLLSEVVPGVEPITYDKTLALLEDGWTLISTDKAVASAAWVGTIMEYKYTPSGGFVPPAPTDLQPLTALYLKTDGGGGVGINYVADGPVIYSKELEAGWNLIGIPSTVASTSGILSPVRYVTAGTQQVVGLTTLVSQGEYNQFSESFYLATLTDPDWVALNAETLKPFDGYWIHMEAADTFEVPSP